MPDSGQMEPQPSQIRLPPSLETSRIPALPPAAYYIADFLSEEEEQFILHKVARCTPRPQTSSVSLTERPQGRDGAQGQMEATHAPPAADLAVGPRQGHAARRWAAARLARTPRRLAPALDPAF